MPLRECRCRSGGVFGGTPTAAGSYSFGVTVSDNSTRVPQTVTRTYALAVDSALAITNANPLPGGVQGIAYAQQFANTGGTPPFSWSIAAGLRPPA